MRLPWLMLLLLLLLLLPLWGVACGKRGLGLCSFSRAAGS